MFDIFPRGNVEMDRTTIQEGDAIISTPSHTLLRGVGQARRHRRGTAQDIIDKPFFSLLFSGFFFPHINGGEKKNDTKCLYTHNI